MNLSQYIRDIRARTDDDPYGIDPYFSDAALKVFINNARRKISIDIMSYEKYFFLFPELYIDEYNLPNDFLTGNQMIDIYNQIPYPPMNKANTETTKQYFDTLIAYGNFAYINETRRKFTMLALPNSTIVEPKYNIMTFSRATKTIVIDGVEAGYTLSDITKWDKVKGYIKMVNAAGDIEYARVTKILANTPADDQYTLYISSFDQQDTYKNLLQCYGTVNTNSSVYVVGTGSEFETDIDTGDDLLVGAETRNVVTVTSDSLVEVNTAYTTNSLSVNAYVTSLPTFTDNDTIQFASHVLYYSAIPPEMISQYEEDRFQHEIQDLIPILASHESWMRRSRPDMANKEYGEYNAKMVDLRNKIYSEKSNIYNRGLFY